jgi:gamma-glutamyltranspeptidase/glutathione hydrolase
MPARGIHSVTVPGCVDGWEKLHRQFGRLPWKDLFQPAIHIARGGHAISEKMGGGAWFIISISCAEQAECSRVFLPNGKRPETGDVFRNPDLAHTFELIAEYRGQAFYKGPIAKAILGTFHTSSAAGCGSGLVWRSAGSWNRTFF